MAILIRTNGTYERVAPENGTDFHLKELYRMLDCELVEVIRLSGGEIFICDEEAQCHDEHEVNERATRRALADRAIFPRDYVAGPVLLCRDEEFK